MKITVNNQIPLLQPETPEEKQIVEQLNNYHLKLVGNILEVADLKNNKLVLCDLVDNSVFVVSNQPEAFVVANMLGSKRFILTNSYPANPNIQFFERDRDFDLKVTAATSSEFQFLVGLDNIKSKISENQLYSELALLYNYADFLESKKQEYAAGELEDKYCRFNSPAVTPVIMLNRARQIMGSIRLCQIPVDNGFIVYLSDEVVRYSNSDERKILLAQLFDGARQVLRQTPNLKNVFMRVASGREAMYESLGCSEKNTHIPVIHGQPTGLLNALKDCVKEIAKYKLSLATANVSRSGIHSVPAAVVASPSGDGGAEWSPDSERKNGL